MSRPTPNIEIHDPVLLRFAHLAQERGWETYVVGGFVRDSLMGRDRTDLDITVVGDPLLVARETARVFGSHTVEYERFRTAMVPAFGKQIEFVGTRMERYQDDSRHPIVVEGTLEDDLRRRDFTINAMAASLDASRLGDIVDLCNGMRDLERKVLATPLEPGVTMSDDPLRMMRAARFASQLDFTIDPAVLHAIQRMADRITIISQERITDEFLKILASPRPSIGLSVLYETGLLKHIFPEVHSLAGVDLVVKGAREYAHKDVFRHTLQVVDNVSETSNNVWLRFATLMHDVAKPRTKRFVEGHGWTFHGHEDLGARWQEKIFRRMKLPLDKLEYVQTLVRLHQRPMQLVDEGVTDSAIRRLVVQAGETVDDLFLLCRADVTTRNPKRAEKYLRNYDEVQSKIVDVCERDNLRSFQSPIRGEEIMKITGLGPSRTVGYLKWMIEEAILDGLIPNDHDVASTYLMQHLDQWVAQSETARFGRRG